MAFKQGLQHSGCGTLLQGKRSVREVTRCTWWCRARAAGKINEETGSATLKRLLYLTSRGDSKALGQAASGALMFSVRHSSDSQAAQVWKHLMHRSCQNVGAKNLCRRCSCLEASIPRFGSHRIMHLSRLTSSGSMEFGLLHTSFPTNALSSCAKEPRILVRVGCYALRDFFTETKTGFSMSCVKGLLKEVLRLHQTGNQQILHCLCRWCAMP